MTHRTLDHEERLRHALRAAAESVEPEGDGLERIRARIATPRSAPAAWMAASSEPSGPRTGPVLRSFRDSRAMRWLFPAGDGGSPSPYRWLRPIAAMAAFVLIIGSGALALTTGSTSVLNTSGQSRTGDPLNLHKGGGSGHPAGNGQQVSGSPTAGSSSAPAPTTSAGSSSSQDQGQGAAGSPNPTPSASCPSNGGPSATASPPEGSPTPSSPSPSPTPSSDSPSPSTSPNPSSGTTTPSTPSTSSPEASATVVGVTTSSTPTPKPKKHRPHPTC